MIKKFIIVPALLISLPINISLAASSEEGNQTQSLNNTQLAYTMWDRVFNMRTRVSRYGNVKRNRNSSNKQASAPQDNY